MPSYRSIVIADGAVGYWRLGESAFANPALDEKANSNGVYTNTTGLTFSQTGILGAGANTAVRFVRTNSGFVEIPVVAANSVGDVFTLEAWIKRVTTGTLQGIFGADAAANPGMYIDAGDNWIVRSVTVADICISTVTLTDTSSFHHLVWTKNGASTVMYLDSSDVTGTITNQTIATASKYHIGVIDSTLFGDMIIDEVAIYPTVLSGSQVLAHYQAGTAAAVDDTPQVLSMQSHVFGHGVW